MICSSTEKYIIQESIKRNIVISENYKLILNKYCEIVNSFGYNLEFRKGRNLLEDRLGANAGLFKFSSIVATPEWALQLVSCDKEEADNAFMITLGHELTHKEKELSWFTHLYHIKLYTWINEVHADFCGVKKMKNSSRKALVQAIDYKITFKEINNQNDVEDITHPSWRKRKFYAENFDFNHELVQQIAKDVNCTNEKIVQKVANFYDNIILN